MRNEVEFWPHMEQLWIRFQRLGIIIKLKKVYKTGPSDQISSGMFFAWSLQADVHIPQRDPVSLNRESTWLWNKMPFFPAHWFVTKVPRWWLSGENRAGHFPATNLSQCPQWRQFTCSRWDVDFFFPAHWMVSKLRVHLTLVNRPSNAACYYFTAD